MENGRPSLAAVGMLFRKTRAGDNSRMRGFDRMPMGVCLGEPLAGGFSSSSSPSPSLSSYLPRGFPGVSAQYIITTRITYRRGDSTCVRVLNSSRSACWSVLVLDSSQSTCHAISNVRNLIVRYLRLLRCEILRGVAEMRCHFNVTMYLPYQEWMRDLGSLSADYLL